MYRAVLVSTVLLVSPALAQDAHQHGDAGKLGTVKFANSCSAAVQPSFARGMAQLHSFEFGPASDAFKAALDTDPTCGIAQWGITLAQWGNPFSIAIRPQRQMEAGRGMVERGAAIATKTPREHDYIAAVATLYDHFETVDQRTRITAYRDAMARLAAKYPDDPEASTFFALALAAAADPADKTYVDQLKAGAMLEKLWETQPDHPGIPHYIIHSYDVPALASRAVTAARRYAKIAPDAPHALHMPSHTFTRLGYWQDSIETNILSAAAARKAGSTYEELHATDYQVYAYLQSGQDAAARRLVDGLGEVVGRANQGVVASAAPPTAASYAVAAIPARYALERGAWPEAARLEPRPSRYAYADAMTWFARALGGARERDVAGVKTAIAELQKAIDRLTEEKETYWIEQVTIQKIAATAWLAFAEGRTADARAAMREAADREDRTEKAPITPGPLAPARELLGEMLLQQDQPKEALAEFEKTIAKEPNRFRALAGAAAAATKTGDRTTAAKYYRQLLTICAKADTPGRPELQTARSFAGRTSQ
jgi:tetratricopeptide (TPR) repeat protein